MSSVQNTNPEAALAFRDLSASQEKKELLIRIGLAIAFVLVLIGTIVGIRHFVNSPNQYFINRFGNLSVRNDSAFAVFPGFFGTVAMIAMIATFIFWHDMEKNIHGEAQDDLKEEHNRANRLFQLQNKSFQEIYRYYYKDNGGLGPLVRAGVISPEQGTELRALFKQYAKADKVKCNWTVGYTLDSGFVEDVKQHSEKYPTYQEAMETIAMVNQKWAMLQKGIGSTEAQE